MTGGKNLPYCTLYKIGKYGIQHISQKFSKYFDPQNFND